MEAYQRRVVDEKTDLEVKLARMKAFCLTSIFQGLPSEEKIRLTEQEMHMIGYLKVLGERIAAFQ